jgi:hypothetical protein
MWWIGAWRSNYRNYIRWSVYRLCRRHLWSICFRCHWYSWYILSCEFLFKSREIRYGTNGIIRGLRENDSWKNLKKKILKISLCQFPRLLKIFLDISSTSSMVTRVNDIGKHLYVNFLISNVFLFFIFRIFDRHKRIWFNAITSPVKEKE